MPYVIIPPQYSDMVEAFFYQYTNFELFQGSNCNFSRATRTKYANSWLFYHMKCNFSRAMRADMYKSLYLHGTDL